jgi:hypothetical protein
LVLLLPVKSDAGATASGGPNAPPPDLMQLLMSEIPGLPGRMKVLTVSVGWPEGSGIASVRRTTLAFDREGALEALEKLSGQSDDIADQSSGGAGDQE